MQSEAKTFIVPSGECVELRVGEKCGGKKRRSIEKARGLRATLV